MSVPLRLLILEDSPSDAELVVSELARAGFETEWQRVETEDEFLSALSPSLDVVVGVDTLPDYDAGTALRQMKDRGLDIPFIVLSTEADTELAVKAVKDGMEDYVIKDRVSRLGLAIPRALEHRRLRQESRAAEAALREREEQYRTLVEESPYGIAIHQDGRVVFVNRAAELLMGAEGPDELLGRPISTMVHPAGWEMARERIGRMLQGEAGLYPINDRYVRLDGSVVPVEVTAVPVTIQGRPAVQVIALDMTDRKLAEEHARESEERFRATFEQAAVGIAHIDLDGRWLRVNRRLCDIVGYTSEELLSRSFRITHVDDLHESREAGRQMLAGNLRTALIEKRYVRKDGSLVWVHLTLSLVRRSSGEPDYFLSIVEDISERKLLEAEYLQAQKMEGLGQLAAGIAHDFNNVLTVINGTAAFISEQLKAADPLQADVREIVHATDRAAAMTRQLLAFGRRQIAKPQIVDLGALILNSESMLRRLLGEDINVVVNPTKGPCGIKADPVQIDQVVMNLAVNARDAMPTGGELVITTQVVELHDTAEKWLGPPAQPGQYAVLTVSDTGMGMDEATRARAFEPFFTTKEAGQGTGLGLATVFGIIRQSGGAIWVDSNVGKGTTFKMAFPLVAEPVHPDDPPESPDPGRGTETIMVVEDYAALRKLTRRMLESAGYAVVEASGGTEALQMLARLEKPVALLLTDVVMPGLSGVELAERVAESYPDTRVVYTSGYSDDELMKRRIDGRVAGVLTKPYTNDDLMRAVREALDAALAKSPHWAGSGG